MRLPAVFGVCERRTDCRKDGLDWGSAAEKAGKRRETAGAGGWDDGSSFFRRASYLLPPFKKFFPTPLTLPPKYAIIPLVIKNTSETR